MTGAYELVHPKKDAGIELKQNKQIPRCIYGGKIIVYEERIRYKPMNYQIEDKSMPQTGTHTIKLENRKIMSITGVIDVDGFDEHTIVLATSYGIMTIHGNELHINKLNIEEGCLNIDGDVAAIQYSDADVSSKGSWLSKMFK